MKAWILSLVLFAVNCSAATYYIDYANGSDSNSGASNGAPWKHHPYMSGSTVTGYSHAPGDRFIFKGGVTWDHTCFPFIISVGGASGKVDYYGVDKTWYAGSVWVRPIFDNEYVACTTHRVEVRAKYVNLDNFEMKRLLASSIASAPGLLSWWGAGYGDGGKVSNCYLHGWRTQSTSDNAYGGFINGLGAIATDLVFENGEIENSENIGIQRSGMLTRCVAIIRRSKMHDNCNGVIYPIDFDHSELYNITGNSFDPAFHTNGIYIDPVTVKQTQGYIRNSYLHDVANGANMAYVNIRGGATVTLYNNVLYGTMSAQLAVEIEPYQYTGEGPGNCDAYNNTIFNFSSSSPAFHVVNRTTTPVGRLRLYNNHIMNASSLTDASSANTTTLLSGNNLLQSSAVALVQGYTLANLYAPTSKSCITYNAGQADTVTGNSFDILGASRTADSAWDIGAYEFGSLQSVVAPSAATIAIVTR